MKRTALLGIALLMLVPALVSAKGQKEGGETVSAGDEMVKIEFFQRKREVVDLFEQIIAEFEKAYPNIDVEQVHVSDHDQVLQSRLASNKVPDVLTHWPNQANYVEAAKAGFFLDLSKTDVCANVVPEVTKQISLKDGSNYAAQVSVNTQGIFFNKGLFEEKGYATPKTWAELISLCDTIVADGGQPFVWPDATDWTLEQQLRMLVNLEADGEKMMDQVQGGTKTQDIPALKAIAEEIMILRQYGQGDSLGTTYEQACAEFATGNSYMFWQGIWAIPNIKKANPDMKVSMFALPSYTGQTTRVEYGEDLALVIGNTGNKAKMEAAKTFVKFVTQTEVAQIYGDKDGSPSTIKGVVFRNEISKPLVDMVQSGKAFRNIRYRWPAGGMERSRKATQQYLVDKDVDKWLEELNSVFGHPNYM
jgi:raffinose/stachyose/melibiose transport system substrate-binding protein